MDTAGSTLADTLLDDLDDLSDVEDENVLDEGENEVPPQSLNTNELPQPIAGSRKRLLDDPKLTTHMNTIQSIESIEDSQSHTDDYQMVVESNKHLTRLYEELIQVHRDLCTVYKEKFPELEALVPDPIQYMKAVRCIGNETDVTAVQEQLQKFLQSQQIITITVSASTTNGRLLTEEELRRIQGLMNYIEEILEVQGRLTKWVESRMTQLCPNVAVLVGPSIAARLLGLTGGLAELSRIPACNLQVLGQVRANAASRAGLASKHHQGLLKECDLVQSVPQVLQNKVLKMVAAKVALAVRCDISDKRRVKSAAAGRKWREEILNKVKLLEEPDKAQVLKALPKPDLTIKKRRGGKRMRKLKERYEETSMMKQANTRAFSTKTGEYGDDAMGLTRGLLDTEDYNSAGGSLRQTTKAKATRVANTKASRKRDALLKAAASAGNSNGLATSISFTPVQGMELVNPEAKKRRVEEANQKWFNNDGFKKSSKK